MTPRSSVRAAAREIYGEMAQASLRSAGQAPSSLRFDGQAPSSQGFDGQGPSSQGVGGQIPPSQGSSEPELTAKARALYEGSAVPVAEIARLCGVTERTIYKYAAKGGWKPRYRWTADGTRPAAFTPAKGAGGRFIRRADKGKPFATGLKALDPAGRGLALGACGKAGRLSGAAQQLAEIAAARAALRREVEQQLSTIRHMMRYLSEIRKIEATQQERAAALSAREQDKAKAAEADMEMRVELARRIGAMMQQRRSGTE